MARELNLSDEQQRAFMLKASMKKLSSVTTIPTRKRKSPAEEAVDERVFASEKGFLKNSKVTDGLCTRGKPGSTSTRYVVHPPGRCWPHGMTRGFNFFLLRVTFKIPG